MSGPAIDSWPPPVCYELGSALVHAVRSHDDEGAALLQQGAVLAAEVGDHRIGAQAFRELGYVDALAGRRPAAAEHLQQAETLAGDDPDLLAGVHSISAFNLGDWGRFERPLPSTRWPWTSPDVRAAPAGRRGRSDWVPGSHLADGDVAEARAWTDACLVLTESTRWVAFRPWPAAVLAETQLADGGADRVVTREPGRGVRAQLPPGRPVLGRGDRADDLPGVTPRMASSTRPGSGSTRPCSALSAVTDTYASMLAAILATAGELSAAAGDDARAAHHARPLVALAARAHLDHYLARGVALLGNRHAT